jgi:hypothetical protein
MTLNTHKYFTNIRNHLLHIYTLYNLNIFTY